MVSPSLATGITYIRVLFHGYEEMVGLAIRQIDHMGNAVFLELC